MDLEGEIQSLRDAGRLRDAATKAVEGYGPEVLGFLVTILRDETSANEVFSQACEDLWQGLDRFEGRSSLRTWFYVLARHAAARFRRAPHRRPERRAGLSEVSGIAEHVRSRTLAHLRTEVKDGFAAIRNALPEDDRALLVLRVDRKLSWNEIACVFSADGPPEETAPVAAKLRKRFERLIVELRERAREAGLVPQRED
ncbi:MAG TPA: sigma-70 family RNA polymerase sigma factor [Polyangiaceae bacterium]|nr:sigma-70 family RNA polymerase sigma factor [Polyangiaceae bacterium]